MRRATERGFTLIEIMIVVAIIALLAAIAIPNVLRGRASANETASIGNMRAMLSSLEMYRSVNNAYPDAWSKMGSATPPFYPQPFQTLPNTVQGFAYAYTYTDANTYAITGIPQTPGTTGSRQFLTNQSGLIRHCLSTSSSVVVTTASNTIDASPNTTCP